MYHLTNEERETLIRWSVADKTVHIDSADPTVIRKLDKLCASHPETYACTANDEAFKAKQYTVADARYVRFGKPASEARREVGRRRAAQMRFEATAASNS